MKTGNLKKDKILEEVTASLVELTDNEFHVKFASDGAGTHIEISISDIDEISKKVMNTFLSSKKDYGYHAIVRKCPPLYIKLLM